MIPLQLRTSDICKTYQLFYLFIYLSRIVRLISPNLNYIIIVGAIFLYLSIIFFVFPTTNPILVTFACHVSEKLHNIIIAPFKSILIIAFPQFRIWLQTLGYFMCFGTIVAKMWRIYFIFHHPRVKITNRKQMVYSLLKFNFMSP